MNGYMEIKLDYQEKDLLMDCIQYRLYTDKILVINNSLKNEIKDLWNSQITYVLNTTETIA